MTQRILIVEDHAVVREPLARLLKYEGYETDCAANGQEALERIQERRPDLILLDLMMPKMDGSTFLERIRNEQSTAGIDVIVMTGVVESALTARVRQLGVQQFCRKGGFAVGDLLERIRQCDYRR